MNDFAEFFFLDKWLAWISCTSVFKYMTKQQKNTWKRPTTSKIGPDDPETAGKLEAAP